MPQEQGLESIQLLFHGLSVLGNAWDTSSLHTSLPYADKIFVSHFFPSQDLFHASTFKGARTPV